jgi:hypothetical protein
MVFSPREHADGDSLGRSGSELSLNQLAGPDAGGLRSLPDELGADNQQVRDDAGLWREKDAAARRLAVGGLTPRTRGALHSQSGRYQSTSQLAHLKLESRRASQRLAEAAAASTGGSFDANNQAEEEGATLYGSIADAAGPSFGSSVSPPRRHRQSFSSRRSTAGSDLSTIPPLSAESLSLPAGLSESFSSSTYSPIGSMEFLNRDVEEEERALRSKSDKERAFLYKLVRSLQ